MVTRRRLLQIAGTAGAAAALPSVRGRVPAAGAQVQREERRLTAVVMPQQTQMEYVYVPFDLPPGVHRLDARIDKKGLTLGFGLFDQRGPHYQSDGFRGIYGGEGDPVGEGQTRDDDIRTFFLTETEASVSMIPGPFVPGTWTFIVPVFFADRQAEIEILLTLTYGPSSGATFSFGPEQGVVRDAADWYRGDLHCHTPQSSDAAASGTALSPREWAETCRRHNLDFAAMTDHNVVSQNFSLAADAGADVLLLPGEEMTNWYHGHATVSGITPGDWLDWRQRPSVQPLRTYESRITEFLEVARGMGAFTSAAHPVAPLPGLPWQFFQDSDAAVTNEQFRARFPDGIEVWTGPYQIDDDEAVSKWDSMLQQGRRVTANGGSDLHGAVPPNNGFRFGTPTTVVYAERLEKRAIVDALRAGRCFLTRAPNGGELYLTAEGPDDQATFTGGTLYGASGTTAVVRVLVVAGPLLRRYLGSSLRLILLGSGRQLSVTRITQPRQTVELTVPLGSLSYVRAELRSEPERGSETFGTRADMEALTNPIFFSVGERSDGSPAQEFAPPRRRAPRRANRRRRFSEAAVALVAGAAGRTPADPVTPTPAPGDGEPDMSLFDFRTLAASDGPLRDRDVVVSGRVTRHLGAGLVELTEHAADCCGLKSVPLVIEVATEHLAPADLAIGNLVRVVGRWEPTTGAGYRSCARLDASRLLTDLPPCEHDGEPA